MPSNTTEEMPNVETSKDMAPYMPPTIASNTLLFDWFAANSPQTMFLSLFCLIISCTSRSSAGGAFKVGVLLVLIDETKMLLRKNAGAVCWGCIKLTMNLHSTGNWFCSIVLMVNMSSPKTADASASHVCPKNHKRNYYKRCWFLWF